MKKQRKGLTLVELLVVIAIIALLISILLPALGRSRTAAQELKCTTNVRAIMQGAIIWAQSNDDSYPLPSALDKDNATIAGLPNPMFKDCSKNVYSLLIYYGLITPELCISPAESSGSIKQFRGYSFAMPQAAMGSDKTRALWDPAFRATQTNAPSTGTTGDVGQGVSTSVITGSISYAHNAPLFNRKSRWRNTFTSTEPTLGNRGPAYSPVGGNGWRLSNGASGTQSNTLRIHGQPGSWEGNIAFNDNHVEFVTRPDPQSVPFNFSGLPAGSASKTDNIFVNENDSTRGLDANLQFNINAYFVILSSGSITATGATPWRD